MLARLWEKIKTGAIDSHFIHGLELAENGISKILSMAMIFVVMVSIVHLGFAISQKAILVIKDPTDIPFTRVLFEVFGLFLNVLIALEILENISAYLKKNVIQVELVIVTSIIAVARKIIIIDLEKKDSNDLIALAISVVALSIAYAIVRQPKK
jgi:uncharacterized membrane protein (DUF373 family)